MTLARQVLEVLEALDESVGKAGPRTRQVKKVVRKGKIIKRLFCRPGYKAVGKACVKMAPLEQRNRAKSQRVAGRKRGARSQIAANMKRKRSNRLRKSLSRAK